jgi:hypothetical protein
MTQNQPYILVIRMAQRVGMCLLFAAVVTEVYLMID